MENPRELSDELLNVRLRESLALERQAVELFLAFLLEFDCRKAYEVAGYSSLFTYLVEGLHLSEPAAAKRVAAVRLIRRWPGIKERLRTGSIHLTSLYMVSKHLTEENFEKILDACHHRGKRWVEEYLMQEFQAGATFHGKRDVVRPVVTVGLARHNQTTFPGPAISPPGNLFVDVGSLESKEALGAAPVPAASATVPQPTIYPTRVRISADMEAEALADLKRAKELLGAKDFGEVIGKALKNYLGKIDPTRKKPRAKKIPKKSRESNAPQETPYSKKRSRYVPVQTKAEVHLRDKGQCTYVSPGGQRCSARARLQLEHRLSFARGGSHGAGNLELHCPTHNHMKARQVFGEAFIAAKVLRAGGDPLTKQAGDLHA